MIFLVPWEGYSFLIGFCLDSLKLIFEFREGSFYHEPNFIEFPLKMRVRAIKPFIFRLKEGLNRLDFFQSVQNFFISLPNLTEYLLWNTSFTGNDLASFIKIINSFFQIMVVILNGLL